MDAKGTKETKDFYDKVGWSKAESGASVDADLFGVKEDGPLRIAMHQRMWSRINAFLSSKAGEQNVLEVGCGGTPCEEILRKYQDYTGTDFSSTGLQMARENAEPLNTNAKFVEADAVDLPFEDETFDTVYSAHMIYHIEERRSQHAALREMARVTKTGGSIVLLTANPRPILFPARMIIRLVAESPVLGSLARKLKGKSPIPYNPARLSFYKGLFSDCSKVQIINGKIASTAFNQRVSEISQPGKSIWALFNIADKTFPRFSAYLGNYAVVLIRK